MWTLIETYVVSHRNICGLSQEHMWSLIGTYVVPYRNIMWSLIGAYLEDFNYVSLLYSLQIVFVNKQYSRVKDKVKLIKEFSVRLMFTIVCQRCD